MTRPNITPGPWYLGKRAGAKRAIYGDKGVEIALPFDFFMEDDEALANARAIAAVPQTHKALERALGTLERMADKLESYDVGTVEAIRSALTAAGYQF